MSRKKIWLIIAISFLLTGCIIFGGAMSVLKWDFSKLSTVKYETNAYEINEIYKNISIVTDTADVVFVPSENAEGSVTCHEQKNAKHTVAVKDGTLVIQIVDMRKWYEHIGISFSTPKITVYLPQGEYSTLSVKASTGNVRIPEDFIFEDIDVTVSTGDVHCAASASGQIRINTSTGDICTENVSADALDLSASTGKVIVRSVTCGGDIKISVSTGRTDISDTRCKNMISDADTGNIVMKNMIATEKLSVERSTGSVKLDGCDAAEIFIKTDTGSVSGSLLSDKVFVTQTDTGSVDVPKTVSGGRCEITTDTGDIRITLQK